MPMRGGRRRPWCRATRNNGWPLQGGCMDGLGRVTPVSLPTPGAAPRSGREWTPRPAARAFAGIRGAVRYSQFTAEGAEEGGRTLTLRKVPPCGPVGPQRPLLLSVQGPSGWMKPARPALPLGPLRVPWRPAPEGPGGSGPPSVLDRHPSHRRESWATHSMPCSPSPLPFGRIPTTAPLPHGASLRGCALLAILWRGARALGWCLPPVPTLWPPGWRPSSWGTVPPLLVLTGRTSNTAPWSWWSWGSACSSAWMQGVCVGGVGHGGGMGHQQWSPRHPILIGDRYGGDAGEPPSCWPPQVMPVRIGPCGG